MTTQHALIVEDAFGDDSEPLDNLIVTVEDTIVRLRSPKTGISITFTHDEWQAVARFVAQQLLTEAGPRQPNPDNEVMRFPPRAMFERAQPVYFDPAVWEPDWSMFERAQPVYFDPAVWEPDWSKIDEKYNAIAKDHDGGTWGYTYKPTKLEVPRMWQSTGYGSTGDLGKLIPESVPWDESLFERPGEHGMPRDEGFEMSAEDEEHPGL